MFYVIRLCILHFALPKSVFRWKVCYIYFLSRGDYYTAPELYLRFYWYVGASYNGFCIVMFLYVIKYNCWLYFILVILFCIPPVNGLFHHCTILTSMFSFIFLWILYLCFLRYVFVLNNIYWIIPVYYLLLHCCHPCWPKFTIVD